MDKRQVFRIVLLADFYQLKSQRAVIYQRGRVLEDDEKSCRSTLLLKTRVFQNSNFRSARVRRKVPRVSFFSTSSTMDELL